METTSRHSFYKILMDFTIRLGLPEGFTEKCNDFSPIVKLKIAAGATWDVRVEELEGEGYFFTDGWTKFCQDMKLKMLEVLVFSYDGNSTFDVSVFAKTASEKKSNFRVVNNPHFLVTLKLTHLTRFYLRMGFIEASSGLRNKKRVRLEYPGGQTAEVPLRLAARTEKALLYLGKGWSRFWKTNSLTVDKSYSIEFIPSKNVIRVVPVEHEEEEIVPVDMKKRKSNI